MICLALIVLLVDYRQKIRNLEADKLHLEEHCTQLEKNVRDLLVKLSGGSKSNKNDVNMSECAIYGL